MRQIGIIPIRNLFEYLFFSEKLENILQVTFYGARDKKSVTVLGKFCYLKYCKIIFQITSEMTEIN